ncbi:hypothetical protein M406DRAFT_339798 [Cryphonectria parasitica EP155]|uniref:T6SS Phospholipase effector Tle1-like catalytic domain-containing protein n=1 Tax=Cryphonectria parasitica (strain ATCC 38755 / EP155) TaxID=660469 RepID=A0A9P4Y0E5_CRYP1|nr:uncharacterized protein M406DRAFT_339798 [Cryphonectria parasitica EP155]KAF3764097.1 hypothetical protein M406DRAFT_339798 [Cryphonectria parasitica EP155]
MASRSFKRLIVCCDGSWMNALGKQGESSPPSNVWRICRLFRNVCENGCNQIVYYHAGVGSSGSRLDSVTGGDFGVGLDADIRELYSFICMNYVDGDDIILIGFSRGAFTARAVADMIASLGLLSHNGLDHFYEIFTDYQLMGSKSRDPQKYLFKGLQPYGDEKGTAKILWEEERKRQYRHALNQMAYTRDTFQDGVTKIKIKAVAVWDTALALDEPRAAFRPALWERVHDNETNLKQVWFPGSHANVGGGYYDQQIANITLAWMCDQLMSVAVEFDMNIMKKVFLAGLQWSAAHPFPWVPSATKGQPLPWANSDIFPSSTFSTCSRDEEHDDVAVESTTDVASLWATARPWGLGQTRAPTSLLQKAMGQVTRRPGHCMRIEEDTNEPTHEPLMNTGEAIHSSVRVRLVCGGLSMDDEETWTCKPLRLSEDSNQVWELERVGTADLKESLSLTAGAFNQDSATASALPHTQATWQWSCPQAVARADNADAMQVNTSSGILPEEPLTGICERTLLALTAGQQDVWKYAEDSKGATS